MIEIIDYEPAYHDDFKAISLQWLYEYGLYEEIDGAMLNYPKTNVLDKSGLIFLARVEGLIVGSIILLPQYESTFELLKLGVSKRYRNRGIGMALLKHSIEQAKLLHAESIIIETSSKLEAAICLYEKLGFTHIAPQNGKYELSDVSMELLIPTSN